MAQRLYTLPASADTVPESVVSEDGSREVELSETKIYCFKHKCGMVQLNYNQSLVSCPKCVEEKLHLKFCTFGNLVDAIPRQDDTGETKDTP